MFALNKEIDSMWTKAQRSAGKHALFSRLKSTLSAIPVSFAD